MKTFNIDFPVHKGLYFYAIIYYGKPDRKNGSLTWFGSKVDSSFVGFHNIFYHPQTKAHTTGLGGEFRFELGSNTFSIDSIEIPIPLSSTVIFTKSPSLETVTKTLGASTFTIA